MDQLLIISITKIILRFKCSGLEYPDRCRDINSVLKNLNEKSYNILPSLKELFAAYSEAVKKYACSYEYDVDVLKELSLMIEKIGVKKIDVKKIPVKYRGVTILEDVDADIFAHELEVLISKVISNKFEVIGCADRFEVTLEKDLEELADIALKSLITFV